MNAVTHRANHNVQPLCGAPSGRISTSGVFITCQACIELGRPLSREEGMRQLVEAAERYRAAQGA